MGLGGSTHDSLSGLEGIDFRISVEEPTSIVLSTHLRFDLHVRPTTYIYARLREVGVVGALRLRRGGGEGDGWVSFDPLSLLTLGLRRGDEVQICAPATIARADLLEVMDAFRACPLYRSYAPGPSRCDEVVAPLSEHEALEQFRREFESSDDRSHLLKLHIENFIVGHVAEIEAFVRQNSPAPPPGWQELDDTFKHLLYGAFEHFGISSLDVPYDNLLQVRDMCYHLHFRQVESGKKLPYSLLNVEWSREYGQRWRRMQGQRQRYFYERESGYYRDLFLVLVMRERTRLREFVERWRSRLDYSLRLRGALREEVAKFECELHAFSPNFDNPDEFLRHIESIGGLVVSNISRLTPFLQLLRDERIYSSTDAGH